jgi:hypothetical protein
MHAAGKKKYYNHEIANSDQIIYWRRKLDVPG